MYKILYVVLDGAADGVNAPRRSLEEAMKPSIDRLASHSLCGLVYTVGKGIAPESDVAVLSLLGYNPAEYYTGRGPLEAVGADVAFQGGDVALRANYATVDPKTLRIIDRRAGRSVSTREARILAEAIDGMKLDNGHGIVLFRATVGHRGVLVLRHDSLKLKADITNTDPAYERIGRISHAREEYEPFIQKAKPLTSEPGAIKAAELVNEFTMKSIEILDSHPINRDRRERGLPPANAILLRDAGDQLPNAPSFYEKFGLNMASIVEMPVERGIARVLGLSLVEAVRDPQEIDRKTLLEKEAEITVRALNEFDGIYVHLKGPDEPGHDGDLAGKIKAIEEIDEHFFSRVLDEIDLENTIVIVTSDHATPWHLKAHSDDPVPLMFSNPRLPEKHEGFNEVECRKGALGVLEGGYNILPTLLDVLSKL